MFSDHKIIKLEFSIETSLENPKMLGNQITLLK